MTITRKTALENVVAAAKSAQVLTDEETLEVIKHMIEQLAKPRTNSGTPSPTSARKLNERIAVELARTIETGKTVTCSQVCDKSPYLGGEGIVTTPQKAVGVMNVAVELGYFTKGKVKKTTIFTRTEKEVPEEE